MFLSNRLTPLQLLSQFLGMEAVSEEETSRFRTLQHNRDLCPRFRQNCRRVLDAYISHSIAVHDLQGFNDRGCDVIVRFTDDEQAYAAGLQLKSHKEMETWVKRGDPHFVKNLRSQHAQALSEAKVDIWYLVLCTDAIAHRDAIRTISATFDDYERTKVVEPVEALTFFGVPSWRIDALATQILCKFDAVRSEAVSSLAGFGTAASVVAVRLLCRALNGSSAISQEDLLFLIDEVLNEYDIEAAANIISHLEGRLLIPGVGDDYVIEASYLPAVCAVYYDLRVRYSLRAEEAGSYLEVVLDVDHPNGPPR